MKPEINKKKKMEIWKYVEIKKKHSRITNGSKKASKK